MRCLYRVRPYELETGSADALHRQVAGRSRRFASLNHKTASALMTERLPRHRWQDFDALPIRRDAAEAVCRHCGRDPGQVHAPGKQRSGRGAGAGGSRGRRARAAGLHGTTASRTATSRPTISAASKKTAVISELGVKAVGVGAQARVPRRFAQSSRFDTAGGHQDHLPSCAEPFLSAGQPVRRGLVPGR